MSLARLVFHEDGSITTHEVVKTDRIELAFDTEKYNEEQVREVFSQFMSLILGKPVQLDKINQDKPKKIEKNLTGFGNVVIFAPEGATTKVE